jgi:hypothetical protein
LQPASTLKYETTTYVFRGSQKYTKKETEKETEKEEARKLGIYICRGSN